MSQVERKRWNRRCKRQLEAISRKEQGSSKFPPPKREVPPPPAPPAPSGKGQPAEVVELPPGGGFKGQGKYGSLGLSLPLPVTDTIESSPAPEPLPAYSEAQIDQQFGNHPDAYFRIYADGFWDGKDIGEVQKGTRVLWGVAKGRNGGESTKVEFFSGLVHGWTDSNFIIVS